MGPEKGFRTASGRCDRMNTGVLIVGAGGLGCPAALYLAGAGVGTLGIIDGDTVECSNLHRQVLHRTKNVGKFKVDSAIEYLQELNPHPKYIPYRTRLTPQEAPDIFVNYDIILDSVLLGKAVVSASALRTEGQLMILNHPPRAPGDVSGGPCYRCVFPIPPPADSVVSCAEGGILGPVVGLMGVMQAVETIRVITSPLTADNGGQSIVPALHLFSAYSTPPFRNIRLRKRRANCSACSAHRSISIDSLRSGSTDYVQFCGSVNPPSSHAARQRITPAEYNNTYLAGASNGESAQTPILIDVREKVQFDVCALSNSVNIPISQILASSRPPIAKNNEGVREDLPSWLPGSISNSASPVYVVCRQGNDSQLVVQKLRKLGIDRNGERTVTDIKGGLKAWRIDVEPDFPDY
ncbi:dinucleotide-utilizing enzyme [Uncinocarpus reesii 1704]|uniref:Dinucleotide-utilizing enzyme n=1 Tax=Uncinocarpus reesii (strain UAMH 1704) TaxID=336963 RepID=C4JU86_UNCRE|nr:dinucleotide-utilizing enzyme [Uncinocarpus reesii 1704]EEP81183.1 dinucleotide-utilizing enzyme [Uncinocarpus reesii 1704]